MTTYHRNGLGGLSYCIKNRWSACNLQLYGHGIDRCDTCDHSYSWQFHGRTTHGPYNIGLVWGEVVVIDALLLGRGVLHRCERLF